MHSVVIRPSTSNRPGAPDDIADSTVSATASAARAASNRRTARSRASTPRSTSRPVRCSACASHSASTSASQSPAGTTHPHRPSTVSGSAPASLTMLGTPIAPASTAAPWLSDRDGETLTSAAA